MTLEETVDITRIYATKNISQWVVLKKPEPVKGIAAIRTIEGILETKCRKAVQDIGLLLEKDDEEGDSPESEKALNKLVTRTYKQIKAEVSDLYKKLKVSGLPKDDEKEFKEFLKGYNQNDVLSTMMGLSEQDKDELQAARNIAELGKRADELHANYLASAGINTEEGKIAWTIVYRAGLMFKRATHTHWEKEDQLPKDTIRIGDYILDTWLRSAINEGLRCASEHALIEEREKLRASAVGWLSNEIKSRLSKGLEFNLLDCVSVWEGKDDWGNSYVYMRLDYREPYTTKL